MNIVLIGYRCSGKTTVGKILAQDLGRQFVDTDRLVEEKTGLTVHACVSQKGWKHFRQLEGDVVKGVAEVDDLIISTGGGVVMAQENVRNLGKNGWFVWLKAEPSVIRDRMKTEEKPGELRPSLSGKDPLKEIDQLIHERTPFYASTGNHTVDTNGQPPEKVARAIMKAFRDKYPVRGGC